MASIISAGTTSGTALNMAGDTSGQLQLATNGSTTALTIDTSQNVGIGTSSPATRLHVSRNTAGEVARFVGSTDVLGELTLTSVDNVGSGRAWGLNIVSAFGEYRWAINNTERMRIDSSGRVLVGKTSAAGYPLEVKGAGVDGQTNTSVSTSAVTIYTVPQSITGVACFVFGDNGSAGFMDLVFFLATVAPKVVSSQTMYGTPPTRTYTTSTTNLQLALSSGPHAVRTAVMGTCNT